MAAHVGRHLLPYASGKRQRARANCLIDRTDTSQDLAESIEQEKMEQSRMGIGQSMAFFAEHMMFTISTTTKLSTLHIVKL